MHELKLFLFFFTFFSDFLGHLIFFFEFDLFFFNVQLKEKFIDLILF